MKRTIVYFFMMVVIATFVFADNSTNCGSGFVWCDNMSSGASWTPHPTWLGGSFGVNYDGDLRYYDDDAGATGDYVDNTLSNIITTDFSVQFDYLTTGGSDVTYLYISGNDWPTGSPWIYLDFNPSGGINTHLTLSPNTTTNTATGWLNNTWHKVCLYVTEDYLEFYLNDTNESRHMMGELGTGTINIADIEDVGIRSDGINTHYIDNFEVWEGDCLNPPNAPATLETSLRYPINTTHYNHAPGTSFNGSIIINGTQNMSCYINDTRFDLVGSNLSETIEFQNNTVIGEGNSTIFYSCSGTTDSEGIFWFVTDLTDPVINLITPLNNTKLNGLLDIPLNISFFDLYIYAVNVSIKNSSGGVIHTNYSGSLSGLDEWYNISYYLDYNLYKSDCSLSGCNYSINMTVADTHTNRFFDEPLDYAIDNRAVDRNSIVYSLKKGDVTIEYPKDTSIETTKLTDRYIFRYNTERTGTKTITIKAEKIVYLPDSPFKDHLIINDAYWFDTEGTETNKITKVSDGEYRIDLIMNKLSAVSRSLGGLNEVQEVSNFSMDSVSPYPIGNSSVRTSSRLRLNLNFSEPVNITWGLGIDCLNQNITNTTISSYSETAILSKFNLESNTTYYLNLTYYDQSGNKNSSCYELRTLEGDPYHVYLDTELTTLKAYLDVNESKSYYINWEWILENETYSAEYGLELGDLEISQNTGWYNSVEYYNNRLYAVNGEDKILRVYSITTGSNLYNVQINVSCGLGSCEIYDLDFNGTHWFLIDFAEYLHILDDNFQEVYNASLNTGSCKAGNTNSGILYYNGSIYVTHYNQGVISKYNSTGGCIGIIANFSDSLVPPPAVSSLYGIDEYDDKIYLTSISSHRNIIIRMNNDFKTIERTWNITDSIYNFPFVGGISVNENTAYLGTYSSNDSIFSVNFVNKTFWNYTRLNDINFANITPTDGGNWSIRVQWNNGSWFSNWVVSSSLYAPSITLFIYDEETGKLINNLTEVYFISDEEGTNQNIGFNISGNATLESLEAIDYNIYYESEGYNRRHYFLSASDFLVGSFNLFLLNESKGGFSILRVIDQNLNPIEGAIVKVKKSVPGFDEKQTISILRTNFEGEATLDFVRHTDNYQFVVEIDDIVVLVSSETQVSKEVVQIQISLTQDELDSMKLYSNSTGTARIINGTVTDKICRVNYIALGSRQSCARLYSKNLLRNDLLEAENCSTDLSGVLTIPFDIVNNTLYLCELWVDTNTTGTFYPIAQDTYSSNPGANIFGRFGLLLGAILTLGLVFIFRESPAGMILGGLVGLILSALAFLISIPWGGLVMIIIIGGFFILKMRK